MFWRVRQATRCSKARGLRLAPPPEATQAVGVFSFLSLIFLSSPDSPGKSLLVGPGLAFCHDWSRFSPNCWCFDRSDRELRSRPLDPKSILVMQRLRVFKSTLDPVNRPLLDAPFSLAYEHMVESIRTCVDPVLQVSQGFWVDAARGYGWPVGTAFRPNFCISRRRRQKAALRVVYFVQAAVSVVIFHSSLLNLTLCSSLLNFASITSPCLEYV